MRSICHTCSYCCRQIVRMEEINRGRLCDSEEHREVERTFFSCTLGPELTKNMEGLFFCSQYDEKKVKMAIDFRGQIETKGENGD